MAMMELLQSYETNFILAQIAGFITAILAIIAVQLKEMKSILLMGVVTNALTVTNYWLLGEMSGAWICLIAIVQSLWIFYYSKDGRRFPKRLNYIFMLLYSVAVFVAYQNIYDILSWVAAICFALAVVQLESSKYRLIICINSLSWIVYDIMTRSYTMGLTHGLIFLSTVIAIIRLDRKQKTKEDRVEEIVEQE